MNLLTRPELASDTQGERVVDGPVVVTFGADGTVVASLQRGRA